MVEYTGCMEAVSTINEVRTAVAKARRANKSVGLVPTMGALHEGHLSLIDASRAECDFTVATIFVNPTQFGAHEDLSKYPRPLEADLQKLRQRGTDLVFTPAEGEIYTADHGTFVDTGAIAGMLEGAFRPTHFRGVATIVLKLLNLIPADRTYFGQKDFQQTLVIKRMVADLNVPVEIRVCPTVREPDGLAMSSRNAYLSPNERHQALAISRSLREARTLVEMGERSAATLLVKMRSILSDAGIEQIDYVVLADPKTLDNISKITGLTLAAIAARVGSTRLIDNELLAPGSEPPIPRS
jgi:pantoate--beta-alanine ligase